MTRHIHTHTHTRTHTRELGGLFLFGDQINIGHANAHTHTNTPNINTKYAYTHAYMCTWKHGRRYVYRVWGYASYIICRYTNYMYISVLFSHSLSLSLSLTLSLSLSPSSLLPLSHPSSFYVRWVWADLYARDSQSTQRSTSSNILLFKRKWPHQHKQSMSKIQPDWGLGLALEKPVSPGLRDGRGIHCSRANYVAITRPRNELTTVSRKLFHVQGAVQCNGKYIYSCANVLTACGQIKAKDTYMYCSCMAKK